MFYADSPQWYRSQLMNAHSTRATFFSVALFLSLTLASRAQTTSPASGALNIHVTAVQGQAQYRSDSGAKWKPVEANTDLPEGVEFRTGPKGAIQFTVGTDQVFRVDRLTVVKVLQANLNSDGTIRTDVGMTYGRVSKDVDLPAHPHQDTITTPCSTLAVRGTQVSMYDQPPYTPEAISLTGTALFHFNGSTQFAFGSKGGGTNKVAGDTVGAAQNQLNTGFVDPNGNFAGHTSTDVQNIQNNPGAPPPGPVGNITQHTGQIIGGMTQMTDNSGGGGSFTPGSIAAEFSWAGNTSDTVVGFTIVDPKGDVFSSLNPPVITQNSRGPLFIGSATANQSNGDEADIAGFEEFIYGTTATNSFPAGNYKITVILEGAEGETLQQIPFASVNGEVVAIEIPPGSGSPQARRPNSFRRIQQEIDMPVTLNSQPFTLNSTNSTATFNVPAPLHPGQTLTPVLSH
jgi:hypothetical protein